MKVRTTTLEDSISRNPINKCQGQSHKLSFLRLNSLTVGAPISVCLNHMRMEAIKLFKGVLVEVHLITSIKTKDTNTAARAETSTMAEI